MPDNLVSQDRYEDYNSPTHIEIKAGDLITGTVDDGPIKHFMVLNGFVEDGEHEISRIGNRMFVVDVMDISKHYNIEEVTKHLLEFISDRRVVQAFNHEQRTPVEFNVHGIGIVSDNGNPSQTDDADIL